MYGIAEFQSQTDSFAMQMISAVCRFYQKHQTAAHLKSIHFIIQPEDTKYYDAFNNILNDHVHITP